MADEKPVKKDKVYKVSSTYEVSSDSVKKKTQDCPKCGPGFRMAKHANRNACGKCAYTEFN